MNASFASAYSAGPYGGCAYNDTTCSQAAAGNNAQPATTSGSLVNTGTAVLFIVSLACLIICASLVVRFAKRKRLVTEVPDDEIDPRILR